MGHKHETIMDIDRKTQRYKGALMRILETFKDLECDCPFDGKKNYRQHSDHCPVFVTGFIRETLQKA